MQIRAALWRDDRWIFVALAKPLIALKARLAFTVRRLIARLQTDEPAQLALYFAVKFAMRPASRATCK